MVAGKVCARFMPHFIALVKFPKLDSALHQPLHVHPFVLPSPQMLQCISQALTLFPIPLQERCLPAQQLPRAPRTEHWPSKNKRVLKTDPSGLQFASSGTRDSCKANSTLCKRDFKTIALRGSARMLSWTNNEPSVRSSLLPLSLPSGLKSELPKNGRVPLHLRPPCLHPAKNSFLAFFFFFFCAFCS